MKHPLLKSSDWFEIESEVVHDGQHMFQELDKHPGCKHHLERLDAMNDKIGRISRIH